MSDEHKDLILCASPTFGTTTSSADSLLKDAGLGITRLDKHWRAQLASAPELDRAIGLIVGTEIVDRAVLERASRLRVIAKHGVGVDNIDVVLAESRDIIVTNAPGQNAVAVAEHTLALMLAVARHVPEQTNLVRSGGWAPAIGIEIEGKVLGVVGMGDIGRRVASKGVGLGMEVIYFDVADPDFQDGRQVDLRQLLRESDFVTLQIPLTKETRGLIGTEELRMMKRTAVLINTARGGLIDERALAVALDQGEIHGAGIDVFGSEPPGSDLLSLERGLAMTSHIAGYTEAALTRTSLCTARNIIAVAEGRRPPNPVAVVNGELPT